MRYVLNSAVITRAGTYQYSYIGIDEAIAWLDKAVYYATLGYPETVQAFNTLFHTGLEVNRETVRMKCKDEALVFRLRQRLPYNAMKGTLTESFILEHLELGLLRRVL